MRKAPAAPAAVRGLLRCFHRSPAACADKHLCAPGTTLWAHLRNLLCKGKVGRGAVVAPRGELCPAGASAADASVPSVPCPFACWLRWPSLSSLILIFIFY